MKRFFLFLPLLVALILGVFLYWGIGKDPTLLKSARLGKPVPDFNVPSLRDPNKILTVADLKNGKVSLLNVWATWCTACRQEHPWLVKISQESGVPIYGVDYKDERGAALKWLKDLGDPYKLVIFDKSGNFGLNLGVYGVPETYILDRNGIIRYRQVGAINGQIWQNKLLPLIKKLQAEK